MAASSSDAATLVSSKYMKTPKRGKKEIDITMYRQVFYHANKI